MRVYHCVRLASITLIITHYITTERSYFILEAVLICKNENEKSMGHNEILEEIYEKYYKNVYNYIAFRINNHHDVEELVSTVFEKAIRNWKKYNPNLSTEAWLISIAKNTSIDYLRRKMRKHFVALDSIIEFISPSKQPEEVVVIGEENRALMKAMTKLKDKERQILSMKFATDLKHSEIAYILNISESNVGVITHRALKKLRQFMEGSHG